MTDAQRQRIERERQRLNLRPWEFSPSEISDEPNPCRPGTAGFTSWEQAAKWRAEIRQREPAYFAGDDD